MSYNLDPNNGTRNQHLTKVTRRKRSTFTLDNELAEMEDGSLRFGRCTPLISKVFDLFDFSLAYPSSCVTLKPTEAFSYIAALQDAWSRLKYREHENFGPYAATPHPDAPGNFRQKNPFKPSGPTGLHCLVQIQQNRSSSPEK